MYHPTDRIPHTMAFVTPVVKHWLEQVIYSGFRYKIKFSLIIFRFQNSYYTDISLYRFLLFCNKKTPPYQVTKFSKRNIHVQM